MRQGIVQFGPGDDPRDPGNGQPTPLGAAPGEGEDLPYKVEVWDENGGYVEQVVAVSISPSIGYAAYYAATREYPGRIITLRHRGREISRWSGLAH